MITRRTARVGICLLLAAGALAACGGDDAGGDADADADTPADESTEAAFPVTIEHKYGEVTVDAAPERVVSVGFTDQDLLLALDVVPVGIRDWYGEQPFAVWPWAQDELGDAEPEVLSAEALNYEAIAALTPDLIVGVSSGMTEEEYEKLSAIAPTLPQSGDFVDYGMPWQDATRMVGEALGRPEDAEAVVEETEALFAAAREEHPEFAGQTGVIAFAMSTEEVGGYGVDDTRSQVLTNLGFEINPEIAALAAADDAFYAAFSNENIERLESDVVVWVAPTDEVVEQIRSSPLRDALAAAREGREVFMDFELGGAAGFSSPLSLPYVLERLVPMLALAADGDPATAVDEAV